MPCPAPLRCLQLLREWQASGHKALVFCQTQQMLDIVESFVRQRGMAYRRMDGATAPGLRSALIDEFNANAREGTGGEHGGVFVFLLTTRVGGLGTNLTAANRVVIFDPDWNPATDMQASSFVVLWVMGVDEMGELITHYNTLFCCMFSME